MRQYNFIAILLFTWLISCDNEIDNHSDYTLKDSVLKDHIQRLDSAIYFDTTDLNFKVLKAYKDNDTIFFKKLRIDIEKERQYKLQWDFEDSCLNQPKLQHLNVDKAYRFIFTAAFCPYKLNVTVAKNLTVPKFILLFINID